MVGLSNHSVQALLHIVQEFPRAAPVRWSEIDQAEFIQIADVHRVTCLVATTHGADVGLSASTSKTLRMIDLRRRFRRAALREDLNLVIGAMDEIGVAWAVVKGPALSEELYAEGSREFSDLDILVSGRDLDRVIRSLVAAGAVLVDGDFQLLTAFGSGELSLLLPGGTPLDLHWHLIHELRVRRRFQLNIDALLARRRSSAMSEVDFPTLDSADRLLHLCVHACLSGGERLLWAKDIDLSYRSNDWSQAEFVSRVRDAGVMLPVVLMLMRTRDLMATPISRELLQDLGASSVWVMVMRVAERLSPAIGSGRRRQTLRLVYRATRSGTLDTAVEVLRVALYASVLRGRADSAKPWRQRVTQPASDPNRTRQNFLDAVADEARNTF